jgi:hypothetical protein
MFAEYYQTTTTTPISWFMLFVGGSVALSVLIGIVVAVVLLVTHKREQRPDAGDERQ